MSASQFPSQSQQHAVQYCTRCGMVLPPTATFCRKCGGRLEKPAQLTKEVFPIDRHVNLERYRITSLMRRAPYVQLSLAMDTQQQWPVAIRDIDIQQIDISSRSHIFKELQREYDLLRQRKSNDVLPLIASFHEHNHLYSISAWPRATGTSPGSARGTGQGLALSAPTSKQEQALHIYTLQDLLQSGIGLPDEQIAVNWILRLANAIEHLHRNHIVIGTLDPSTILVNQKDYSGQPTLFPSWMLPTIQSQLQQALNTSNASPPSLITPGRAAFFSPEAKQGQPERRSDIYSMGALLYLLMTGIAPTEQSRTTSEQLRSPREINPRVQHMLSTIMLKALAGEPSARFQSINEFAAVLLEQQAQSKVSHRLSHTFLSHNRSANTDQQGQEPLNAEHKESTMETDSEDTIQLTKEKIQQPQGEKLATAGEVTPGSEDGLSSQNTPDNTALASEDEPNTDNQQLSSTTDTEERTETQTNLTDAEVFQQEKRDHRALTKRLSALFERVKRFVIDGQPRTNNIVAMIETPMRIQPNKNYTIRINIMGRNEPKHVSGLKQSNDAAVLGGLGSLIHGERVHIEVRSALYHNYAYIVQQTDVEVPAANYAAEITIPMRSITDSLGTKRENLHIFFTDEKHNPLYEKPFVIELFISTLVQSGNEGHNALSIPL